MPAVTQLLIATLEREYRRNARVQVRALISGTEKAANPSAALIARCRKAATAGGGKAVAHSAEKPEAEQTDAFGEHRIATGSFRTLLAEFAPDIAADYERFLETGKGPDADRRFLDSRGKPLYTQGAPGHAPNCLCEDCWAAKEFLHAMLLGGPRCLLLGTLSLAAIAGEESIEACA